MEDYTDQYANPIHGGITKETREVFKELSSGEPALVDSKITKADGFGGLKEETEKQRAKAGCGCSVTLADFGPYCAFCDRQVWPGHLPIHKGDCS